MIGLEDENKIKWFAIGKGGRTDELPAYPKKQTAPVSPGAVYGAMSVSA